MAQVDALCTAYVAQHFPPGFSLALLAGNSVGTDKIFLEKDLPQLHDLLHYRVLDVSTLKELASRWNPDLPLRPKYLSDHRARSDILASIDGELYSFSDNLVRDSSQWLTRATMMVELKYYRQQLFKIST